MGRVGWGYWTFWANTGRGVDEFNKSGLVCLAQHAQFFYFCLTIYVLKSFYVDLPNKKGTCNIYKIIYKKMVIQSNITLLLLFFNTSDIEEEDFLTHIVNVSRNSNMRLLICELRPFPLI